MVIDFNNLNLKEKPTLVLKTLDGKPIQTLGYAFDVSVELSYNELSTLEFKLPAVVDNTPTPHYDDVVGMKVVDLVGIGEFVLVDPEEEIEGTKRIKSCKAYSLEYEFAKKNITLEDGTFNFYDPYAPDDTVLGRIMERLPRWSIGEVDDSLVGKYRTFDVTQKKVYDFIKSTVQETYGCIFEFDTYQRLVNVVSVDSVVPQKAVYLSNSRLINKAEIEEESDSIVTCLNVSGADGVSIRGVNPTGQNVIYKLDYFMNTSNFPQSLIDKWNAWTELCESYRDYYYNVSIDAALQEGRLALEKAALETLNGEKTALENSQAAIIEMIASGASDQQSALDQKNRELADKQSEIAAKKVLIAAVEGEATRLSNELKRINNILSLHNEENFTEIDLELLQPYFIEDTVEDNSFDTTISETYLNTDISNDIVGATINVHDSDITIASLVDPEADPPQSTTKTMYRIEGGRLSIGISDDTVFSAKMIRGTLELNQDETFMLTSYLDYGTIGEDAFDSGCITLSGSYSNYSSDQSSITDDEFTEFEFYVSEEGTAYFTKNNTEYEQHSVEWDLLEYGQKVLDEKAYPSYTFSVESGNFLAIDDFASFKNELTLGHRVYLNIDDDVKTPYVTSVSVNFEDMSDFKIEFSSTYTSANKSFELSKLFEDSISMGKTLKTKGGMYSEFVYSGASNKVKEFMDSALDIAKNTVLSSGSQAIEFGDAGIRVRKWADQNHTAYSPEQIWIVDNMIAFTKNNWTTANMAIGKIFDHNLVRYQKTTDESQVEGKTYFIDDNGTVWDSEQSEWSNDLYEYANDGMVYGIAAPYLVGTILAGQNLVIDTENGAFKVDESGVYIDALDFHIRHGEGSQYDTTLDGALNSKTSTYRDNRPPENPNSGDIWYNTSDSRYVQRNIEVGDDVTGIRILFDTDSIAPEDYPPASPVNHYFITGETSSTGFYYKSTSSQNVSVYYNNYELYSGQEWTRTELTPEQVDEYGCGIVSYVDKSNVFYSHIYGEFDTGYEPKKMYRYNGTSWDMIEDGDIDTLEAGVNSVTAMVDGFTISGGTFDGYLDSTKLSGVISAGQAAMRAVVGPQSNKGSVLFDDEGFWLLDKDTKSAATKAIWMNHEGILFGSGSAVGSTYPSPSDPESGWKWQTGIGLGGITTDGTVAAGSLSGFNIYGGALHIGPTTIGGVDAWNFEVDKNGNMTARSGTFTGTLKSPTLDGLLKPATNSDSWLLGCGLKIGKTDVNVQDSSTTESDFNFFVDRSGNVTMNGSINMSSGSITWGSNNSPVKVLYARTALSQPTNSYDSYNSSSSSAWHKTFDSNDKYASYSYNGGQAGNNSWTTAIKVKGEDGIDGSDADVPGYIQDTYIDFSQVQSPQIIGNFVLGSEVQGGKFFDTNKVGKLELSYNNGTNYSDLTFTRVRDSQELFKIYDPGSQDNSPSIFLGGSSIGRGGGGVFYPAGEWDFTPRAGLTVTGLSATAVFG